MKYKGGDSDGTVSITSTTGGAFDVNVVVDGNGLILGMAITPTKDVHVPAASWQELEAAVKALPAPTNLTVTEVTEGKNAEVFSVGDTSPQPTGSTIKLYVLGAVATAVQNGTLSWDQKLTITDDLKSMPGGTMQDLPSGTGSHGPRYRRQDDLDQRQHRHRHADRCCRARAGRSRVSPRWAWQILRSTSRSSRPAHCSNSAGVTKAHNVSLGATELRTSVERYSRHYLAAWWTSPASAFTTPAWPFDIDWFASPADLRAALVTLQEKAKTESGAPVRNILAEDPALSDESAKWFTYGGFKGGSSIGVLAGAYYVEHDRSCLGCHHANSW